MDKFDTTAGEKHKGNVDTILRVKKFKHPKLVKYRYAQDMASKIGTLEDGDHIEAIVSGNFIAGDLIESWLYDNKQVAEEVIIGTLSMSSENVDSLKNVIDTCLTGKMGLIVSDYFYAHEKHSGGGIQDIKKHLMCYDNFFLAVAGIHTKISLIKLVTGQHIVIGGSANLRSSMNIEHITMTCSKEIYDFHRSWMSQILNKYQVEQKFKRRDSLWQRIVEHGEP